MNLKKWILAVILALGVILSVAWIRGQIKIDSCLDNGGRWNYEQKVCEPNITSKRSPG